MVSFDIFDTLITRKMVTPMGVFLYVQKRAHLADEFVQMRINAEKDARLYASNQGIEEITLQDIYDLLSVRMNQNLDNVMALEIQAEIEAAYPIQENINQLKKYIAAGDKVVLISDMYLDEKIIRNILVNVDSIFENIHIYVSCDYKKTKSTGSLFLLVEELEHVDKTAWQHFGDNVHSDYQIPSMLGITSELVDTRKMMNWERDIASQLLLKKNLLLQYYVGASQIVSLEYSMTMAAKIGASLGAMVVYPYVQWLLKKCSYKKIQRLYFIARDGYVLKTVADIIIKQQKLNIKTYYIYGSRKAWRLEKEEVDKRQTLLRYLKQEIDLSDNHFALVDLHGTGVTMEYVADILEGELCGKLKVFYYDLLRNNLNEKCEMISFCSNHSGMAEVFCRAPHGATIGYKEGEHICPVMHPIDESVWHMAGLDEYIRGIKLSCSLLASFGSIFELLNGTEISETAVEYCQKTEDKDVLRFLGEIPHCENIESEKTVYAPPLSKKDIFDIYMWRTIEPLDTFYNGVNLNMSLRRTNKKWQNRKVFFEKHYLSAIGLCIHRIKIGCVKRSETKKKIVIYAAGRNGKALYAHLKAHPNYKVVAWTDIDFNKYIKHKYPVIECKEAIKKEFDTIIITIADKRQREIARNNLEYLGVSTDKILYYDEFLESM